MQTEIEIMVSKGRIKNAILMSNGNCKLLIEIEQQCGKFVKILASELTINGGWYRNYKPKTEYEKKFKKQIRIIIKSVLKAFYRPNCDPSFNKDKSSICYIPGREPATDKPDENGGRQLIRFYA